MEIYDPAKIGSVIARAGWNVVYRYGTDEVIKFSRLGQLSGLHTRARVERDISVGGKFFGTYMLETRFATSADGRDIALIQKFVRGRILRKTDMTHPVITQQFRDLIARHEKLVEEGYAGVDLMSGIGFLFGIACNIFLLEDGSIKVIDVMLIDMLSTFFQKLVRRRQAAILASYLD